MVQLSGHNTCHFPRKFRNPGLIPYSLERHLPIYEAGQFLSVGRTMSETVEWTLTGKALVDLLQALLVRGSAIRIEARGCSMSPFIRSGDVVTVSPLRGKSPRSGDVVLFRISGSNRLVIHRVAGKINESYLIRGDNCEEPDGLASKSDILGRICAVERNGAAVRFGLGLERRLVAFASRNNVLFKCRSLVNRATRLGRSVMRGLAAPETGIPT